MNKTYHICFMKIFFKYEKQKLIECAQEILHQPENQLLRNYDCNYTVVTIMYD